MTSPAQRHRSSAAPLPARPSSFIGREREIETVVDLLAEHRLVTLVGSPGVGKTRLALRAADVARDQYPDGVAFVELAGLSEPELVPGAIATSREALRCEGELLWRVPSLSTPDADADLEADAALLDALIAYEAVRLFVGQARAVRPTFALTGQIARIVAQICRRGHPDSSLVPPPSPLELLGRLVDKSLVQVEDGVDGEPRYRCLEMIRQFAFEWLVGVGAVAGVRRPSDRPGRVSPCGATGWARGDQGG